LEAFKASSECLVKCVLSAFLLGSKPKEQHVRASMSPLHSSRYWEMALTALDHENLQVQVAGGHALVFLTECFNTPLPQDVVTKLVDVSGAHGPGYNKEQLANLRKQMRPLARYAEDGQAPELTVGLGPMQRMSLHGWGPILRFEAVKPIFGTHTGKRVESSTVVQAIVFDGAKPSKAHCAITTLQEVSAHDRQEIKKKASVLRQRERDEKIVQELQHGYDFE